MSKRHGFGFRAIHPALSRRGVAWLFSTRGANRSALVLVAASSWCSAAVTLILRPATSSDGSASVLPGLKLGEPAPDFHLRDLHGNEVSLAGYRGRWLLLNFWGVTCLPCKSEMPALEEAYQDAGMRKDSAARPVILGIDGNIDSTTAISSFLKDANVTYPVAVDTLLRTVIAYHVGGIPTTVLIDPEGKMRLMHIGPLAEPAIERALRGEVE